MKKLWLGLALTALAVIGATPAFFPSTSMRALLVDQNNVPYSIGTAGAAGSFFPSNQARVLLVDENNQPYKASSASGTLTSITATSPLTGGKITTSGSIGCTTATGSVAGCLSSADWTTFNGKQAAGNYVTALTGDVTASGPGSVAATLANTAVTPASYTNTNLTVDAKGRITAASNGTAAATPGITLVQHQTITASATTATFSSLDGDTDGVYLLVAKVVNAGASTATYDLRPNAATTNLNSSRWTSNAGGTAGGGFSNWLAGTALNATVISMRYEVFARKVAHSVALNRQFTGTYISIGAGPVYNSTTVGGQWTESSTNITSLVLACDVSNCIGDGSELWLYKYAQ